MQEDERQIRDVVATWVEASKAGDSAKVLSLMTDDALFLVPGQQPFGRAAFAAMSDARSNDNAAKTEFDGRSEILEVNVIGDWAYLVSRLTVTTRQSGSAQATVRSGHTLTVLTKRAGRWQLHRDANLLTVQPAPSP